MANSFSQEAARLGRQEKLLSCYREKCCREEIAVPGEAPSLLPEGRRFRLVWHDEFNGSELDTGKWGYRTNFWGRRAEWFAAPEDHAVHLEDGKIHLKIVQRPDGQLVSPQLQTGELLWDYPKETVPGRFWPLPSRNPPKFVHRFGYYECRCRLQKCPGWWTAFWMQSETQGCNLDPERSGVEHDIMECFEPGQLERHAFHYNGCGAEYCNFNSTRSYGAPRGLGVDYTPMDSTEFHTYGLLWESTGYSVFVDGRPSGYRLGNGGEGKHREVVSQVPEFILLSTELNGYRRREDGFQPSEETREACRRQDEFVADYVRVFDLEE